MQGIVYLMVIIILYLMAKTVYNLKLDKISFRRFCFWFLIWTIALISVTTPIVGFISDFLGVGRAADLAVYLSVLLLFFFIFKLFVSVEENRKITTLLIRQIALNQAKGKKKNK